MKEIEKVFLTEIKEKKNHAYNNRARTGGGGGSSSRKGVRTAYDYMSNKERKKLNSEIEVFNMYETIIPLKEFKLKDEETQKKLLTRWREIYPNAKIIKEMGFEGSGYFFYELIKKLDIPKKGNYKPKDPNKPKRKASAAITAVAAKAQEEQTPVAKVAESLQPVSPHISAKGSHIQYTEIYTPEQLDHIFTKLQMHVSGEKSKYMLTLYLTEIRE